MPQWLPATRTNPKLQSRLNVGCIWIGLCVLTMVTASPANAQSRRQLELTTTITSGQEHRPRSLETKLSLTAWSMVGSGGARKGGERVIYVIKPGSKKSKVRLPLGCLEVSKKGRVQMQLAHPMDFALSSGLRRVFGIVEAIPEQRLRELASGDDRIQIAGLRTNARVPVSYECEINPDDPSQLIYRAELVGDSIKTSYLNSQVEIQSVKQTLIYDKETLRLIQGTWERKALRTGNGSSTRLDELVEFQEIEHKALSPAELSDVNKQFATLEKVAIGTLPGEAKKDLHQLTSVLEAYTKTHSDGEFASAIPALTTALRKQLAKIGEPKDPDVKGRKLVGKKAPDFKLQDLTGRDVSLADFAGKIVMVTFWGYA